VGGRTKYLATRFCAALALLACGLPALAQERARHHALVVIDLRPEEERKGSGLAPLSGPCNEDVYLVADSASKPLKMAALQSELWKKLGSAGDDKTLTVLNWTIYYNKQLYGAQPGVKMVRGAAFPLPGRAKVGDPGSKCSRQESTRGWFDGSEVTGKHSPLVSVLEGTYAGRPVGVRVVYSPQRQLEEKFKGEVIDSLAVLAAVRATAEALVAVMPH
jgi:hypothetical protein